MSRGLGDVYKRQDLVLLNPAWVDAAIFAGHRAVHVDPQEPHAANALAVAGSVIHPRHHAGTRARLESAGLKIVPVAQEELAKAESGVTCCSLLLHE